MHSLAFGLLAALIVIISAQLAFKEGFDTIPVAGMQPVTPTAVPQTVVPLTTPPTLVPQTIVPQTPPTTPIVPTTLPTGTTVTNPLNPPTNIAATKQLPIKTTESMVDKITTDELLRPKVAGEYIQSSEETEPMAASGNLFKSSYSLV